MRALDFPRGLRRWLGQPTAGFTLVELVLALAIVGALLVTAFGGLRVVLGATQRAEERIDAHQHLRSLATVVTRAIGAAYPYRGPQGEIPESRLLFKGEGDRLAFVTQAPPFPYTAAIAFTAVVLSRVDGEGMLISQRALPNWNPFTAASVVLRDPTVTALSFRYLDPSGAWQPTWDDEKATPAAVEVTLSIVIDQRPETLPPMVVPLRIALQ